MGHDLSFPFNMVKRGWRAVYVPRARASEKMVPSIEGEWRRKRRMMSHAWPIVLRGGLLSPARLSAALRGDGALPPRPALRDAAAARPARARHRRPAAPPGCRAAASADRSALAAALAGGHVPWRPLLLARYYVLTTAALAAGLYDHLRHGTAAGWEAPEGTR